MMMMIIIINNKQPNMSLCSTLMNSSRLRQKHAIQATREQSHSCSNVYQSLCSIIRQCYCSLHESFVGTDNPNLQSFQTFFNFPCFQPLVCLLPKVLKIKIIILHAILPNKWIGQLLDILVTEILISLFCHYLW